jgi:hypothetical protein
MLINKNFLYQKLPQPQTSNTNYLSRLDSYYSVSCLDVIQIRVNGKSVDGVGKSVDGVGKSVDGVGFRPVKLTHPEGFRPRSLLPEGYLPQRANLAKSPGKNNSSRKFRATCPYPRGKVCGVDERSEASRRVPPHGSSLRQTDAPGGFPSP